MSSADTLETYRPADELVIALGKNIGIGSSQEDIRNDPHHLSDESRLTAVAAGALWLANAEMGIDTDILFSTGTTTTGPGPDGRPIATESEAMLNYTYHFYKDENERPRIPRARMLLQRDSFDTRGDAEHDKEILDVLEGGVTEQGDTYEGMPYKRKTLLTVGYHGKRAKNEFDKAGLHVDQVIKSEDVARDVSAHQANLVADRANNPRIWAEYGKEFVGRIAIKMGVGAVLRKITERSRS